MSKIQIRPFYIALLISSLLLFFTACGSQTEIPEDTAKADISVQGGTEEEQSEEDRLNQQREREEQLELRRKELEEKKENLVEEYSVRGKGFIEAENSICLIEFPERIARHRTSLKKDSLTYLLEYSYQLLTDGYTILYEYHELEHQDSTIEFVVSVTAAGYLKVFASTGLSRTSVDEFNLEGGIYMLKIKVDDLAPAAYLDMTVIGYPIGDDMVGILSIMTSSSMEPHGMVYPFSWDVVEDCEVVDLSVVMQER